MKVIVYIYLVVFIFIIFNLKKIPCNLKIFASAFILGLFSISFSEVELVDRFNYNRMFLNDFPNIDNINNIFQNSMEPFYIIFNKFIYIFSQNQNVLYFTIMFIVICIDFKIISKITSKKIYVILFYLVTLKVFWGTYLCRQILAAAFVNLAFYYLYNDDNKKSIIYFCISILFHRTAIVFLVFFVLKKLKIKTNFKLIVLIAGLLIFLPLLMNFFSNLNFTEKYFADEINFNLGFNFKIIVKGFPYILISIIGLIKREKISKDMKNGNFVVLLVSFNIVIWLLAAKINWIYRIQMYFLIPTIMLIPYIEKNLKNKYIFRIFSFVSFFIITLREIFLLI